MILANCLSTHRTGLHLTCGNSSDSLSDDMIGDVVHVVSPCLVWVSRRGSLSKDQVGRCGSARPSRLCLHKIRFVREPAQMPCSPYKENSESLPRPSANWQQHLHHLLFQPENPLLRLSFSPVSPEPLPSSVPPRYHQEIYRCPF